MSQLPVVNVGVIGLGADWQSRYLPALQKMRQRLRVVGVHDDVATRARAAAEQLQSHTVLGIRELLDRTDIRAFLLLGAEWRTSWVVHQLADRGVPVFVGGDVQLTTDNDIRRWQKQSDDNGVTVVPEFPLRFLPSTLRLRELVATKLGTLTRLATRVQTEADDGTPMASMTNILDCCSSLFERRLTNVELISTDDDAAPSRVSLTYAASRSTGAVTRAVSAELTISIATDVMATATPDLLMELTCSNGAAAIHSALELRWSTGNHSEVETLHADRSATEVMLDLFARRVVGGLIPTPDLSDLLRAINDAELVRVALASSPTVRNS